MRNKWNFESLKKEALKYKTRSDFQKNNPAAYLCSSRRKDHNLICSHMPIRKNTDGKNNPSFKWTNEMLHQEALKYNTRGEFQKGSPSAYIISRRRKILDQICSHMPNRIDRSGDKNSNYRWTYEQLRKEALKYDHIVDFQNGSGAAYQAAWARGILKDICPHMKNPSRNCSAQELTLLDQIKSIYINTTSLMDRKVKIQGKPHIKGFQIDIYVPELHKGIEFDGKYFHSMEGLKRARPNWPNEDLINYHQLKDAWFASKGILILHIKEEDWNLDKEACIKECLEFLQVNKEMVA